MVELRLLAEVALAAGILLEDILGEGTLEEDILEADNLAEDTLEVDNLEEDILAGGTLEEDILVEDNLEEDILEGDNLAEDTLEVDNLEEDIVEEAVLVGPASRKTLRTKYNTLFIFLIFWYLTRFVCFQLPGNTTNVQSHKGVELANTTLFAQPKCNCSLATVLRNPDFYPLRHSDNIERSEPKLQFSKSKTRSQASGDQAIFGLKT